MSTIIAQASQTASNMTIDGSTNHVGLHACQAMVVEGLDEDRLEHRAWLMTESHFSGHVNHHQLSKRQASMPDYQCRFHGVPNSRTAYRLPQTTPATQTPSAGITNAIVVGNKQGEVSCDNQNRVKVRLLWSGLNLQQQEETTAYLRVTQPWASNGFGAQFIPRVGDEVLVRFLGGSPNCPLIVDSVHNPQHPHPENANHYRNGFVTQTPDRQGKNQLIFDDSNGKEQIEISTTGNKIETINKTHQVTVGGKQSITIGENQETTVHENQHLTIKQDQELKIGGTQLTEVAKAIKLSSEQGGIELHSKKHTIIEAGESISFSAKKKIVLNAGETISLQVGTTHLTIDAAQLTTFPMMSLSKDTLPLTALKASAISLTPASEAIANTKDKKETVTDASSPSSTMKEEEEKDIIQRIVRLVITDKLTGYTIQSLKGLNYHLSDPAVTVPTYKVNVLEFDVNLQGDIIADSKKELFSFNVTRDAWYFLGETEQGENKFLNRAFIPKNYEENVYTAMWIPSYPNISTTYLPSGLDAFIFTRFGSRSIPAKPLTTQQNLDGSSIDSPRSDINMATDVMIHIGGIYEIMNYDHLGGSLGCFGFIPEEDVYSTVQEAESAVTHDYYDDESSNKPWKEVTDKIKKAAFPDKKQIQILLEPRDEEVILPPNKILEE